MATAECQIAKSAAVHTLLDLLEQRKTRRFGCGMELPAGPLRYQSTMPPIPLSQEEIRYLLFAGVGETDGIWQICNMSVAQAARMARVWPS